ncbi:MAG: Thiol-disulfide oxidoreductase ResA [Syntrophus sp. PtaU1.Bin005]|uniref:TlpA family protein disulfide reductase n=1 Tax=Syntrophus TaxID=43773 RepID=UPI0009D108E6|nr:MAG: Thiol-disulfide oxidoreductase ResA [Syntrophus sp. PtaB.Bin138]OPY83010.1 MAG: Thiol-disulfide oxidoreductase ResA [Syntrophus sp. PtaU1.Bin005]
MKLLRILPVVVGLSLVVFSLVSCLEPSDQGEKGSKQSLPQVEGIEAPDFELPDLEGKSFRLSQHRGKPVLLIFSTTWCAHCRSEVPHLREIAANYGPRGLEVVQIFIQESPQKVSSFARQYQLSYRVLLDERGEVADTYGVRGVPDMILLDRNGRLVCRRCPDLEASLNGLFAKQPD